MAFIRYGFFGILFCVVRAGESLCWGLPVCEAQSSLCYDTKAKGGIDFGGNYGEKIKRFEGTQD
jgi:hypothetical protein